MASRALRMLYREVPAMTCKAGCTRCCGPVPWHPEEWAAVAGEAAAAQAEVVTLPNGVVVAKKPGSLSCPFVTEQGCGVYDRRPMMCRMFGTVRDEPRLTCPEGCQPRNRLSAAQGRRLRERYLALRHGR